MSSNWTQGEIMRSALMEKSAEKMRENAGKGGNCGEILRSFSQAKGPRKTLSRIRKINL